MRIKATTCQTAEFRDDAPSTDAILRKAAKASGLVDREIAIGTTKSFRETKASQKPLSSLGHDGKEIALGTAHVLMETHAIEHLLPRASGPVGLAISIYETAHALPRAWAEGDAQKLALDRDARFMAIVCSVEGLPAGYKDGKLAEHSEVQGSFTNAMTKMTSALMSDPATRAVLQARVDAGMKFGESCARARLGRDEFMKTDPALADRYANDAAFRIGFDAMLHAAGEGTATFDKTRLELRKRDVRCGAEVRFVG